MLKKIQNIMWLVIIAMCGLNFATMVKCDDAYIIVPLWICTAVVAIGVALFPYIWKTK